MKLVEIFSNNKTEHTPFWKVILNMTIIIGAAVLMVIVSLRRIDVTLDYTFLPGVAYRLKQGFKMTLLLSIGSLILSLLIGIVSAVSQSSRFLALRYFFMGYVKLIRGTPLLAQIYLFFYIIGTAWGIENRLVSGILILSIFEGAYISEIIRGSYLSMEQQQIEVGMAIGLDKKTLRGTDVSFSLVPKLNAAGRMGSVRTAFDLLINTVFVLCFTLWEGENFAVAFDKAIGLMIFSVFNLIVAEAFDIGLKLKEEQDLTI